MKLNSFFNKYSIENKTLSYKLSLFFGIFFLSPALGFLYFAFKYDIMHDADIPVFFAILMLFFLFGFVGLRKIFDSISNLSSSMAKKISEEFGENKALPAVDELNGIYSSFQALEKEFRNNFSQLGKKSAELSTLKELSELCYITFNHEDLLHITLERALRLINADIGSIMMLQKPMRDKFVIEASVGLGEFGKRGSCVDFDDSVAKYAVINKLPLLVEDIENDMRIGRRSRPHYATKSFICMPLKTMNDVIGVLTLSRKKEEIVFTQSDIDVLIPLLSNAAFTFDNLRLLRENEDLWKNLRAIGMISKAVNSSLRNKELFQTILHETRKIIPCDMAAVLGIHNGASENLSVIDFLSSKPFAISKGDSLPLDGSVLERVIKQQRTMFIEGLPESSPPADTALFTDRSAVCIATPLRVEGRVTGLLFLSNVSMEDMDNTIKSLEIMGESVSNAMEKERMRLFVLKRDQELETLRQIGNALSSSTFESRKVLDYTMDMIRVVMNVEAGSLLLLNENILRFKTAFNLDVENLQKISMKLGQGIAGYAADRGKIVLANDARRHPHFSPEFDIEMGFKTVSVLAVPMISQGKVIGVIEVLNKMGDIFNDDDEHLLQSIATSVSIALENARLYTETVNMAEKERGIRNLFQKFVPREIVDKIISGEEEGSPALEEFKTITLMNIDIRGFSAISKNMGPQKTVAILNYFFAVMGEIVFKHRGIVDKYLGDGFLALFGAPVAGTSDADNALAAAVEMRGAIDDVNRYCRSRFNAELTMGMSIHTGEVVVGNIGFEKKMDYTVIGDPVNFVFRLQSLCKSWPNEILVSEKTIRAAKSHLNIDNIGEFESDPQVGAVKIYRVF